MSRLNLEQLPANLPVPEDDGASAHLIGKSLPDVALTSTSGASINLSHKAGWLVIYCYPLTGKPGIPLPDHWDSIPGARGCTPQACAFRDHHAELLELDASVFAISTQTCSYQQEMASRLHLNFEVLSDADLEFSSALNLPMMQIADMTLNRRLTMICNQGIIRQVHYPVFPPDRDAARVIEWLRQHQ